MQYNSKINILRSNRVEDEIGSWEVIEVTLHENLPCRINWTKGTEKIQFNKITHFCDAKVFCRAIDITVKDVVLFDEKRYEILNVINFDNMNRYIRLEILKIE